MNITIPRAVVEQALETLETNQYAVANQAPHGDVMAYNAAINALCAALAQPAPEPVARKPLTEEEVRTIGRTYSIEVWADDGWSIDFARAIEAAHGIIDSEIQGDKA